MNRRYWGISNKYDGVIKLENYLTVFCPSSETALLTELTWTMFLYQGLLVGVLWLAAPNMDTEMCMILENYSHAVGSQDVAEQGSAQAL